MHAVVVNVTIHDAEAGQQNLENNVVPTVSQAPGFVAGYWMRREGNKGIGVIVLESEEAARAVSERVETPEGAVDLDSVEVAEVVVSA
jgi:hypothetical protein